MTFGKIVQQVCRVQKYRCYMDLVDCPDNPAALLPSNVKPRASSPPSLSMTLVAEWPGAPGSGVDIPACPGGVCKLPAGGGGCCCIGCCGNCPTGCCGNIGRAPKPADFDAKCKSSFCNKNAEDFAMQHLCKRKKPGFPGFVSPSVAFASVTAGVHHLLYLVRPAQHQFHRQPVG